jgi:hypothetical protein
MSPPFLSFVSFQGRFLPPALPNFIEEEIAVLQSYVTYQSSLLHSEEAPGLDCVSLDLLLIVSVPCFAILCLLNKLWR